jgi:chorismate mutase
MIRGIRGATTAPADTIEAMTPAVIDMMDAIIQANQLTANDVITLFVTVTDDLHSISPAKIIRDHYHWDLVPILCAKEPDIVGLPQRCIRVLIQFDSDRPATDIKHIYQNGATVLRPDR